MELSLCYSFERTLGSFLGIEYAVARARQQSTNAFCMVVSEMFMVYRGIKEENTRALALVIQCSPGMLGKKTKEVAGHFEVEHSRELMRSRA